MTIVNRVGPMMEPWRARTCWTPGRCGARLIGMTALLSRISFDSVNACASSVFWGKVLGFFEDPDDPNQPGDEECMIASVDGNQRLLFIEEVPDGKQVKNRVHLDLKPAEGTTRELELERLLALGAREIADRRPPGRVRLGSTRRS